VNIVFLGEQALGHSLVRLGKGAEQRAGKHPNTQSECLPGALYWVFVYWKKNKGRKERKKEEK
jgi:hypothetical protein